MAKAEKFERVVAEEGVTLHLSFEEAHSLREVFRHVGGNPYLSPRGHVSEIAEALDDLELPDPREWAAATGSVYFEDYPESGGVK